jgi:hypothetical protein
MTTEYTTNFRLNLPDFRTGPWHDLVNIDFEIIDSLLMSIYQGVDTRPWTNNFHFTAGMTAIDLTDQTFWVCATTHTSSAAPATFAQDRAAHPTWWNRVVVGISPRGNWTNSTLYLINDMVTDSLQGIIAVCKQEHTSSAAPATIRADAAYWTYIADLGGQSIKAIQVGYTNTVPGSAAGVNVQTALDYGFTQEVTQNQNITKNKDDITALTTRVTQTETVNTTQNTTLAAHNDELVAQDLRIDQILALGPATTAASVTYNNVNSEPYTNVQDALSAQWAVDKSYDQRLILLESDEAGGVYVSDTAPLNPQPNSLWWKSDEGLLFVRYQDADSTQWVVAVPIPDITTLGGVEEAPIDGQAYVRKDGFWVVNTGGSGGGVTQSYVDTQDALKVSKSGDTMTGHLVLPITPGNTNAVRKDYVDNAVAIVKAYAAPLDAMAYSGMQVNGSMEVSQQWGDGSMSAANTNTPIVDGWVLGSAGVQSLNAVRFADPAPGSQRKSLLVYASPTNASPTVSDQAWVSNRIEGYRISRLNWGTANAMPITIAFWMKANRAGNYSGAVQNGNNTRSYPFTITVNVASTWEYKVITISGDTAGAWAIDNTIGMQIFITLMAGSNLTSAANAWVAGSKIGVTGTINGVSPSDGIYISDFVVLPGVEAPSAARSALIMRPYDQELITCKRYYSLFQFNPNVVFVDAYAAGATVNIIYSFPISEMRSNPFGQLFGAPTGANISNLATPGFVVSKTTAFASWSATTAGRSFVIAAASTGTTFTFDARL